MAELRIGEEKRSNPARNHEALDLMPRPLDIPPFDRGASVHSGKLRAHSERRGHPIGGRDLLIAAHVSHPGAIRVTDNAREFARVPGLKTGNRIER